MNKLSPPKCTPLEIGVRGGIFFGNQRTMPPKLYPSIGNTPTGGICIFPPVGGASLFPQTRSLLKMHATMHATMSATWRVFFSSRRERV